MDIMESQISSGDIDYYANQDSGYHTTFTPSSFESPDLSTDFRNRPLQRGITYISFIPEIRLSPAYGPLKHHNNDITTNTPPRRVLKRPHPSTITPLPTLPTPTTIIAGKIGSLEVNEDKENITTPIPPESPHSVRSSTRSRYRFKITENILPYPNTPEKRNCKISCRSAKKLDFATHTLLCKKHELEPISENESKVLIIPPKIARPNQKVDLLSLLHSNSAAPAIKNILCYLNNEDSQNFCKVSNLWHQIWYSYSTKEKRQEIKEYLRNVKENQENYAKDTIPKVKTNKLGGCLREIHNEIKENLVKNEIISPPHSPRSRRFRKFTKFASLDSRLQMSCVRCSQPAKVTEELTGEEWVECTNVTCLYQFCRACNCNRHPGKSCCQYDLNAPSPSKRKKCEYAVGTMKSRRNLRRLL